jgi:hypothetical protein
MKAIIALGLALAMLGTLAGQARAQSSCGGWYGKCAARCKANASNYKGCVANVCAAKLASCRQSGCWAEATQFGGGTHCGLSKS